VARRALFLVPLLLFAVVTGYFLWGLISERDPGRVPSMMVEKPVPTFDLPPLDGLGLPGLASADLGNGQVAVVSFFASWCLPCRAEHPLLMKLAKEDGVRVFGIDFRDRPEDGRRWLGELGNPYQRVGDDSHGRTAIDFGASGVPETFVIDREGKIRHQHIGPLTADDIDHEILPLIEELSK
jgi:cytochrome c biogenesis protein CcmG/thiol:disulfide interchange protein DsbE